RELAAADLAHGRGLRIQSFRQRAYDDVAIGQDADDPLALHHNDVADIALAHDLGRALHGLAALDGVGARGHDVPRTFVHRDSPFFAWRQRTVLCNRHGATGMPRRLKSLRPPSV